MKKIIFLLCTIAVIIIACQSNRSSVLAKPGDITPDEYTIDINKDTTLVTKNGALLKIPKGSLSSSSSSVTLEIKEAYSIEQMIRSGLTTQAGDEPLSSGGMIYINAKKGQDVKITQAIKVALPADYLDPGMQLFKGEETANGTVNWTNPVALPENKKLTAIESGKLLFESKCASCHKIGEDFTGPDLAHFPVRFPYGEENSRYWYHHFKYKIIPITYHNEDYKQPDSLFADAWTDAYTCNLINRFGGKEIDLSSLFRISSDTSGIDMFSVYNYIQNESDRLSLPYPDHAYLKDCTDSCDLYKNRIEDLEWQKEFAEIQKNNLVKQNGTLTEENRKQNNLPATNQDITDPVPPPVNFDDAVSLENHEAVYYQFSIETFGWYNIDVLLSTLYGNTESQLFVRVVGEYREKMDIFLIIPSTKIYAKGGKADDNTRYAFGFKNGKIFLPQNSKAYIMAVSESSSSIYFALKEFTTSTQQSLEVELKAASKEEFNAAIAGLNTDDLKIAVKDTKNADSIRKTETDLKNIETELQKAESLKPKNCDCDCLPTAQPATNDSVIMYYKK